MVKIFTIGDSLTAGLPGNNPAEGKNNPESSYQYWLEQTLNASPRFKEATVYNFGFPGINSKEIFLRLTKLSKEQPYLESDITIINGGGNDWTTNARIEDSALLQNLIDCCNACVKDGKKVILTSLTPFGDDLVMEQVAEIAGKLSNFVENNHSKTVLFFDWFHTVYDSSTHSLKKDYDSGDHEHLNITGYKLIGTKLAELLFHQSQ